ncbi:MAG: cytochrome b N-terminal domain-containing protein [Candidatus Bipolaricaulia bacterium]
MSALARVRELLRAELRQLAPQQLTLWHILGGLTLFLLFVEITTGILLMVYYRPSADEAYESVFYIINDVQLGWLVHGIHRWGAQLLILLVLVHLMRVYFHEAYRERELNWAIGVVLLVVIGAFAFTGTLLVWDQRAFWVTDAVRRVIADVPIAGRAILYFLWGGIELDANALLRFYVFHVGLLPWGAIGLVMVHLYLVSRQGLFCKSQVSERSSHETYADVVLRGLLFVVLSFGIVLTLAVLSPVGLAGRADPLTYQSVKPAWYFLPAYALLRLLPQGAGLALLSVGMIGFFLAPLWGRHRLIVWGIGLLATAAIALLGILGWYR